MQQKIHLWKKKGGEGAEEGGSGEVMGTHRRLIAGHWEGHAVFRISTYPETRVRSRARVHHIAGS